MLSYNDAREYERIYAKYINYRMDKGTPDALLITYDTWKNYSDELQEKIKELKLEIWTTYEPYRLKICTFEDIIFGK